MVSCLVAYLPPAKIVNAKLESREGFCYMVSCGVVSCQLVVLVTAMLMLWFYAAYPGCVLISHLRNDQCVSHNNWRHGRLSSPQAQCPAHRIAQTVLRIERGSMWHCKRSI